MAAITDVATAEGTLHYQERFQSAAENSNFRDAQGLCVSSLGVGTYLGSPDDATDKSYVDSVIRAVQLGINVIDSAANYRFQRSERSVGKAVQVLTQEHGFTREEIVVCTKGGYLPFDGAPPRDIRRYIDETFVRPGIADFDDFVGGSHCMTPLYLQNQLQQSLQNLGLSCIDVYYIHNPESQLGFVSQDEFYHRIRKAFESLETSRAAGLIQSYGVATWNGFRVVEDAREYHSLSRLEKVARDVGGESHGFRFIQLPYNLAMTEALTLQNQHIGNRHGTLLEAATELGISVVASASILQGRVARGLTDELRRALGSLRTDAQMSIQFVRSTPGITIGLVGMSRSEHVEENAELLQIAPLQPNQFEGVFEE